MKYLTLMYSPNLESFDTSKIHLCSYLNLDDNIVERLQNPAPKYTEKVPFPVTIYKAKPPKDKGRVPVHGHYYLTKSTEHQKDRSKKHDE